VAERCLHEPHLAVDGVRNAKRAEHGLDRASEPLVAGHHHADPLRRRPRADECEQLLPDELERAAAAGALEEADRTVNGRRIPRLVGEKGALEVRERRGRHRGIARRQLLDQARSEAGKIVSSPPECGEGRPARLIGK